MLMSYCYTVFNLLLVKYCEYGGDLLKASCEKAKKLLCNRFHFALAHTSSVLYLFSNRFHFNVTFNSQHSSHNSIFSTLNWICISVKKIIYTWKLYILLCFEHNFHKPYIFCVQ